VGSLDGKVAVITGSTRGIGRAMAEAFRTEGARVVVNGRSAEKGARCLEEMNGGKDVVFRAGDIAKQADVEALVDFTVDHFGRIDICCLNAGGLENPASVAEMTDREWDLQVTLNLHHVFWGMRRALGYMLAQESGRIIVTSSIEGKMSMGGVGGYTAAKHGVNGLVKAAAREVGTRGITVNSICPGLVLTDLAYTNGPDSAKAGGFESFEALIDHLVAGSAIKRPIKAEEVAALAVLLASDAGAGITGANLAVDGGTLPY
jgi:NAD(P)-dependent dehydrogenase (short-subunit alcohol dehydrogenase family)